MKLVKKSVTVTQTQDQWIKAQLERGDYANESEVIRDLIRKEQARSAELDRLRHALIRGEESGRSRLSPRQVLEGVWEDLEP